jgi:WD40 repeat protein
MRYVAFVVLVGCHGTSPSVEVDAPAAPDAASCVWSPPVELTEFSDFAAERDPTETGDLLELYYSGEGAYGEILFASRASVDEPFVHRGLTSFDDPNAVEASPVVSADGLHIVFTSDRSGTLEVYESTRPSRDASWSAPQLAVRQLGGERTTVGAGGLGMTTDALTLVYQLAWDETTFCFTRKAIGQPFYPNCDDQYVMPSPAFDDAYSTIYYNCGTGICARSLDAWPNFKTASPTEEHVAMGTPSGAADPWIEPGGETILFAADRSLFRTTRACN